MTPEENNYYLYSEGGTASFVAKYNFYGELTWAFKIGNNNNVSASHREIDESGNIYVAGQFTGTVDFDPSEDVEYLTATYYETFISKYNTNGELVWVKNIEAKSNNVGNMNYMCVDTQNNVYVAGYFEQDSDFDPSESDAQLNNLGGQDIFFGKYSSEGELIWIKQIAGYSDERACNIVINEDGYISLIGYFSEIVDFDPDDAFEYKQSNGDKDMFQGLYNNNGELIDIITIGGQGHDSGYTSTFDAVGNIYLSGTYEYEVDFNPFEETDFYTSNGGRDMLVEKLYYRDLIQDINENNHIDDNILIYPNPTQNKLNIVIQNEDNTQVIIELLNINGQSIIQEQFYSNKIQINIPDKLSGVYFVKITYNNNQILRKIIKY